MKELKDIKLKIANLHTKLDEKKVKTSDSKENFQIKNTNNERILLKLEGIDAMMRMILYNTSKYTDDQNTETNHFAKKLVETENNTVKVKREENENFKNIESNISEKKTKKKLQSVRGGGNDTFQNIMRWIGKKNDKSKETQKKHLSKKLISLKNSDKWSGPSADMYLNEAEFMTQK